MGIINQNVKLDKPRLNAWNRLISGGIAKAISGLSQMVGEDIDTTSLSVRSVPVQESSSILGGAETLTTAVYLNVSGSATGHVVMVFQPRTAFQLIDMVMGEPIGSTQILGEMETSALGEIGNVMASSFLNALADSTSLYLRVSPPAVVTDMAGAILDSVMAEIMLDSDDVLVVECNFGTRDQRVNGTILVMPSPDLQRTLAPYLGES